MISDETGSARRESTTVQIYDVSDESPSTKKSQLTMSSRWSSMSLNSMNTSSASRWVYSDKCLQCN